MKINNLHKNFYIFFSVIISILFATMLWDKITLPLSSSIDPSETLALRGYNPTNDTIRYIFFISLPLIAYLFSNYFIKNKTIKVRELIFEKEKKIINFQPYTIKISLIFVFFILFEFFSINFNFSNYVIDHAHDGNYLTPTQNYLSNKNFWISTFLTHGASDILYPLFMWKVFDIESIGATRSFSIFLVLFLKLLCVILSYQFTKISNLNKDTKILFFTIFTAILLSMSHYTFLGASYYLSHKDIYIVLFLIFFIELFVQSNFRSLSTILICIIATISIFLQIDRGAYINFVLIFYFLYLIFSKRFNEAFLVFFSLFACWLIIVNLIGFDEFLAFLNNTKVMAFSGEFIHGLKYPEPFFSIGETPDGARATKALLLQLTAGLFVLNYIISNENQIVSSKKILFLFLFLLSLVIYKNALGRSDAAHIRGSHDIPVLLNSFFILNYLLIFIEKKLSLKNNFINKNFFIVASLFFLIFYYSSNHQHYTFENVKNYKRNFLHFINLKDQAFLNEKIVNLIKVYNKIAGKENCVENITYDDAIPYLLKKPSCTKYWASWIASPLIIQKDYINEIKKKRPKYIIYYEGSDKFDGFEIYERIELVNSYIIANYKNYFEIEGYKILEKKQ